MDQMPLPFASWASEPTFTSSSSRPFAASSSSTTSILVANPPPAPPPSRSGSFSSSLQPHLLQALLSPFLSRNKKRTRSSSDGSGLEQEQRSGMDVDSTRSSGELWQSQVHDWELRSNARRSSTAAGGNGRPSSGVEERLRSLRGMGGSREDEDDVVEMSEVSPRGEVLKRRKTGTNGSEISLGSKQHGADQLVQIRHAHALRTSALFTSPPAARSSLLDDASELLFLAFNTPPLFTPLGLPLLDLSEQHLSNALDRIEVAFQSSTEVWVENFEPGVADALRTSGREVFFEGERMCVRRPNATRDS